MKDLRDNNVTRKSNIITSIWGYRRTILILLLLIVLFNIIFNPVSTATTIANWVNDFFGTLVKVIDFT